MKLPAAVRCAGVVKVGAGEARAAPLSGFGALFDLIAEVKPLPFGGLFPERSPAETALAYQTGGAGSSRC